MTADHAQAIADAARAFVRAQEMVTRARELGIAARASDPLIKDRDRKAAALRAAIVAAGFAPVTP